MTVVPVKGRRAGADTVTVTRNEILTGINSPEQYILAIVEVKDGQARPPRYLWIVPEAKHNLSVLAEPELYKARTVGFFIKHMTEEPHKVAAISADGAEEMAVFLTSDDISFPGGTLTKKESSDAQPSDRIPGGAAHPTSVQEIRKETDRVSKRSESPAA